MPAERLPQVIKVDSFSIIDKIRVYYIKNWVLNIMCVILVGLNCSSLVSNVAI